MIEANLVRNLLVHIYTFFLFPSPPKPSNKWQAFVPLKRRSGGLELNSNIVRWPNSPPSDKLSIQFHTFYLKKKKKLESHISKITFIKLNGIFKKGLN